MAEKILIDAVIGDAMLVFRLSKPAGTAGKTYHIEEIEEDGRCYFYGFIHKMADGWNAYPGLKTWLTSDDLQILIEIVNENER